MDEATRLTEILLREQPAAGRCLSPLGRRAAFPKGIPYQTAAARDTEINGTIGQVTDGRGAPLPLASMAAAAPGLDPKIAFLYSSQEGHLPVRQAWAARQRALSLGSTVATGLPMVVHGLTQAVSLAADVFADPDTDVVIPNPCWENYHLLFQLRPGANIVEWEFFRDGGLNLDGFADALARCTRPKTVIVVNFPANPAGYHPTPAEAARLVEILLGFRGPAVVLFDDAYQGMVWEPGLAARSPFWDLVEKHDPEKLFPMKADGATKELIFFGGRIAFVHSTATGTAEEALLSKLKCVARSTVGVTSGPSQALVLAALRDPGLQADIDRRAAILAERYRALRTALDGLTGDALKPFPFNSGVFALLGLGEHVDADAFRQRLIAEESVGVISIPSIHAVRVAYCSVRTDVIGEMVQRIARAASA
jgi:aspartate/methionine/tyrosine aminotransferase